MPRILNIPTRYPELGRLRSGKKTHGGRTPMEALECWRFTSPDEEAIHQAAGLYGGTPQPWADRKGEWELFAQSDTVDIQIPGDAFFSAYEFWGQGGCARRCDGVKCTVPVQDPHGGYLDQVDCICDEKGWEPGVQKDACSVVLRLKVVIPELNGLGVWVFTSSSIYAAMELPAQIELIDALRRETNIMIPCRFKLDYREEKRPYEKFMRRFRVPSLYVDTSIAKIQQAIDIVGKRRDLAPAAPAKLASPIPTPALSAPAGLRGASGEPTGGQEQPHLRARPVKGGNN
jgi:hypothetical protein